jgi:hypothetical protein
VRCQRARTIGSRGARSSAINSAGISASDLSLGESYFASEGRSLVERTKFASSYATMSESRATRRVSALVPVSASKVAVGYVR